MAQDDNKEEEEDEGEKQRKADEFLSFRRQFDGMKENVEGAHSSAEKLKSNGNNFFSLGLYTQATMVYSEALELKPTSTVLLNNRAMAYLKQSMAQEALEDADRSIQLDATMENIKAFWRRAQALLDLERDEDAEMAADEGLKLQANNGHLSRVRRKAREAVTMRSLCGVEWVGKLENGVEKRYEFSKDGTMTMTVIGHPLKATFDLSVENTPQTMVVKMKAFGPGGGPPPPPVPYIYKFHDNEQELWICHPVAGSSELPSSFDGPGFSRLRRTKNAKTASDGNAASSEPLDERCVRYMQEFNEILPLVPPQLPERPTEDEISHEVLLMEKINKLKQRFGLEVHQRAMELAKGTSETAANAELAKLANALRDRLVARKVLPAPSPGTVAIEAKIAESAAQPPPEEKQLAQLSTSAEAQGCLGQLVARLCGGK